MYRAELSQPPGWTCSTCRPPPVSRTDQEPAKPIGSLPDEGGGGPEGAGWLSLGQVSELGVDLPPIRLVEPKPGRLVLFPSTMWHGTRAFDAGERLTVAFDVKRPGSAGDGTQVFSR